MHCSPSAAKALACGGSLTLALCAAPDALACAVCAAGDPTLTTMGAEKAFSGRLRSSAELRVGSVEVDRTSLDELRLDLAVAYAPTSTLLLSLSLPVLGRSITSPDGAEATRASLGDVEARFKGVLWSRQGRASMQFALFAGAKLPTAPVQTDAHGVDLPADLQPGCSSVVPLAGAFYSLRRDALGFYASASFYLPVPIRDAPHAGDSFRTSAALQVQPVRALATRFGVATRLDQAGEALGGAEDPNAGGFVGYVSTELVASPLGDLLFTAGAFFPVVQALRGDHREGTIAALGATYDFF